MQFLTRVVCERVLVGLRGVWENQGSAAAEGGLVGVGVRNMTRTSQVVENIKLLKLITSELYLWTLYIYKKGNQDYPLIFEILIRPSMPVLLNNGLFYFVL